MTQTIDAMTRKHGDAVVRCRNCGAWDGTLSDANATETANGNGVNWMCPECGKLVGTANY